MTATLTLTIAQMTSAKTHAENIAAVRELAQAAASEGSEFLALPEVAGLMEKDFAKARLQMTRPEDDPFIAACQTLANELGIWIHTGSTPVRGTGERALNHSCLIDASGAIVARYSKIHLFDAFLEGRKPIGESSRFEPGRHAVLADTPWGPMGMSICYDLRFPHLYRDYAKAGACILFVPSAFTVPTGRAHWEVLLRARAIETGAWVVAAAQVGHHADGRQTWGHSLVVSPWGEVAADLGGDKAGHTTLILDLADVEKARRQIPSLQHDRDYSL